MHVLFVGSLWGMGPWKTAVPRVAELGYDAVEMGVPEDESEKDELRALLREHRLRLVANAWTGGKTPEEHQASLTRQYENAVDFGDALFVSSQTGVDHHPFESIVSLFQHAERLREAHGLPLLHETHRSRPTFSAPSLQALLEAVPTLELTIDLSHWCCVHESFLEDQRERVSLALRHGRHLHARVGHTQGSQVADPRASEWKHALDHHLSWWDELVHELRLHGHERLTITPEFGPEPYMPREPHSQRDLADLVEVNVWMREKLRERYSPEAMAE